jgi:ABC-2 type transport system permease protein
VTLANPIRHFRVIVKGLFLKAMPAMDSLNDFWTLVVIAVVTLSGSTQLLRRRPG